MLSVGLLVLCFSTKAQEKVDTLDWLGFKNLVKKYHPVTVQAKLLDDLAKAKKTKAIGGFEPKLGVDFDRKIYDGTEYYQFLTPELKLPLWYGLELKGSYSEAEGAYLNPENKLPKDGLSYAGLSFQLGKGLLMDERRAALKQAKIFADASKNQQQQILNDLFKDAGEAYINWYNKYQNVKLYQNIVGLAKFRFEAVKNGFKGGDQPAIDTVEAFLNLQQREVQLQQADYELKEAKYALSNFLWLDNNQPTDPDLLNIVPDSDFVISLIRPSNVMNNPKLLSYQFKIKDLEIERRLKAESLRPEISVGLGLLNSGRNALQNVNSNYWVDNNKINMKFSFPLFLAKARGDLAETKIKIRTTELERELVNVELRNKQNQIIAENETLSSQLDLMKQQLNAAETLLKGEEIKFKLGDSSLFKVNSRETKLIEVNEKYFQTMAKLKKAQLKAFWINGELPNIF